MSVFAALVILVVYLNVPAVLVREWGMPFFAGAAIPLLLMIPLLHTLIVRRMPLKFPALVIAAGVLLLAHAVSAFGAISPGESVSIVIDWALEGMLLTTLIVNVVRTRADVIAAVNAVVAAGAIMGTIVLIQQTAGLTDQNLFGFGQVDAAIVDEQGQTQRRLAGPIGETNRFAQIMVVLIPVSAGLAVTSAGMARLFYGAATLLICAGMSLAFSRGAIVALLLAAPFALSFRLLGLRHIALGTAALLLLLVALPHYAARVQSIGTVAIQTLGLAPGGFRNADGAARGRLTEMKATALVFIDHPVLGAGPGMAQLHYAKYASIAGGKVRPGAREPHNLYLQLAAETGIVGLVAFAAVIMYAFAGLERARKRLITRDRTLWSIACALELALILYLCTSLFLHAAYVRYFWLLLGLCVAASSAEEAPVLIRLLGRMLAQTAHRVRAQQQ